VNPLAVRKQLLIAESEFNRAQLVRDWETVSDDVHALTRRAKTISSLASAVTVLIAGLTSSRREKSADASKPSWMQTILKGAGLIGAFWSEFRARPKS
jgi:hypothetical protein